MVSTTRILLGTSWVGDSHREMSEEATRTSHVPVLIRRPRYDRSLLISHLLIPTVDNPSLWKATLHGDGFLSSRFYERMNTQCMPTRSGSQSPPQRAFQRHDRPQYRKQFSTKMYLAGVGRCDAELSYLSGSIAASSAARLAIEIKGDAATRHEHRNALTVE
jgi:hypothetical protein